MFSRNVFAPILSVFLISTSYGWAQNPQQFSKEDRHMLETYVLSLANLNKVIVAQKEVNRVVAADPSIGKLVNTGALEQRFKYMDSITKIAAPIHSAGLTSKDFALTQTCAAIASMAAEMKKGGAPPEMVDKITPWKASAQQIAFVDAHPTEMKKYLEPMEAVK